MKGTDVTDAQLIHAGQFLQRAKDPSTQTWRGDAVTIHIPDLVRLLAWYGAIRAKIEPESDPRGHVHSFHGVSA